MIEIRVLGRLDLRGSEGERHLSILAQPKRAALLAYLAVATPRGFHRRDKLIGLFWPERDPEHARGALRSALYFLRQSLGDGLIAGRGAEELGLAAEAFRCDAVGFESALEASEYEKALELYRGDLLEGFYVAEAPEFERWLEGERARLRARAAEAAWTLAEDQEAADNWVESAKWARRAVSFSPDDEGGFRRLLELLDRVGDRAGAMKEYEAFARRLQEDYEGEPSPETQALIAEIRERENAAGGGATAGAAESAQAPTTTVGVERDKPSKHRWAHVRRRPAVAAVVVVAMAALAVWGVGATAWMLFGGGKGSMPEVAAERLSIAALPFENRSGLEEDEYFTDGFHGEILSLLSKISSLSVRGRTSVMQYRDTRKNIRQIGDELNARYILEGGVQRAGGTVRINLQLIDAESDEHVWAATYDRPLAVENLLGVQREVALRVAETLKATLTADETERIEQMPTDNLEAYEYYLRGKDFLGYDDRPRAVQAFERAVELDQQFAIAWAELARAHLQMYWFFIDRSDRRLDAANAAIKRAFELDADLPEAHMARALYFYWGESAYDSALSELELAHAKLKNSSEVLNYMGHVKRRMGNLEEAIVDYLAAIELDPLFVRPAGNISITYYWLRRYPEAKHYLDRAIELFPEKSPGRMLRVWLYLSWEGDPDKARAALWDAWGDIRPAPFTHQITDWQAWWVLRSIRGNYQDAMDSLTWEFFGSDTISYYLTRAQFLGLEGQIDRSRVYFDSARVVLEARLRLRPEEPISHSLIGVAYAGLGRSEEAILEAEKATEMLPVSRDALWGRAMLENLALVYATVGAYDDAVDQIELLLSIPGPETPAWLRVDPAWDPLRDHPRFQALLAKYE